MKVAVKSVRRLQKPREERKKEGERTAIKLRVSDLGPVCGPEHLLEFLVLVAADLRLGSQALRFEDVVNRDFLRLRVNSELVDDLRMWRRVSGGERNAREGEGRTGVDKSRFFFVVRRSDVAAEELLDVVVVEGDFGAVKQTLSSTQNLTGRWRGGEMGAGISEGDELGVEEGHVCGSFVVAFVDGLDVRSCGGARGGEAAGEGDEEGARRGVREAEEGSAKGEHWRLAGGSRVSRQRCVPRKKSRLGRKRESRKCRRRSLFFPLFHSRAFPQVAYLSSPNRTLLIRYPLCRARKRSRS